MCFEQLKHNGEYLKRISHTSFVPSYKTVGLIVSQEEIFNILDNKTHELFITAMFFSRSKQNEDYL
jgi:hypothetical protein